LKFHLFLTFWLSLFVNSNAISQNITLDYDNLMLNEILLDINTRYGIQVSISSKISAQCKISLHQKNISVQKAIDLLAEYCDLDVQKIGQVYTFRKKNIEKTKVTKTKRRKRFLFQGEILDEKSLEPLPYSNVTVGKTTIKSDHNGRFSYQGFQRKDLFQVKHLGYRIIDTSLSYGNKHIILITANIQELEEIIVTRVKPVETYTVTSGDGAGRIQLNNAGSKFIPGSNNNFIFNNLRMYPGIMAAGESSSEFIIWGSYPGQGQITYDGITLFNGAGMNGDLGRVNPLMIQNIEVYKGGYNVNIGDRVGSAVIIDSKDGQKKTTGAINLDNQLASFYLSIPLLKKTSTLQIAARKSYYQLIDFQEKFTSDKINFVYPKYDYGDLNLKFTTVFKNRDRIQISSIASLDGYDETLDKKGMTTYAYSSYLTANSFQLGNSINYVHNWKNGGITRVLFAQSLFKPKESFTSTFSDSSNLSENYTSSFENGIDEYQLQVEHSLSATPKNQLDFSAAFIRNNCSFDAVEGPSILKNFDYTINRLSLYVKDQLTLWNRLHLQFGLKGDVLITQLKPYLQPRVNGKLVVTENWNINIAWGIYNQFVTKIQLLDSSGARSLIWSLADEFYTPVQQSMHNVVGLSYLGKSLEFGLEGYYKTFNGIIRHSESDTFINSEIISGYGYGADFFSKLRIKKHEVILSYSLGQFNEQVASELTSTPVSEAEQSQRHEIKTSLNLWFKPVTISISGVYGSGFKSFSSKNENEIKPYSRIDIALKYTKKLKKTSLNTGISILNLLNTANSRLFRTTNFSDSSSYSTLGIPFTPTLFFNLNF
jgi:hypothetical protein